ncbi:hypothetical protein SDC9_207593 [bioreactor metagenome]|uniref:Uncharacterized protein n=1 Tax=bioreactor metagenome TaxID=1076179 RepID=A0A645J8B9_9ZZZZ
MCKKLLGCLLQQGFLEGSYHAVIDPVGGEIRVVKYILNVQIPVIGKALHVDEQFIACKGGTGGIGRVTIPGWA